MVTLGLRIVDVVCFPYTGGTVCKGPFLHKGSPLGVFVNLSLPQKGRHGNVGRDR